jgi:hypothetical protein
LTCPAEPESPTTDDTKIIRPARAFSIPRDARFATR